MRIKIEKCISFDWEGGSPSKDVFAIYMLEITAAE